MNTEEETNQEQEKNTQRYAAIVEEIVEEWAKGKPINPTPGSTKPSGYFRLTGYLLNYLTAHNAFPRGVHAMPEGRDRFNNLEPSFPVDFDQITGNRTLHTLHLSSIPGMRESIQEGIKEAITECSKKLDW
ncbi:MAG: hypothetical protein WCH05_08555 [Chlorobiaceae bacterium]